MSRFPSYIPLLVAMCGVVLSADAIRLAAAGAEDASGHAARMAMLSVGTCVCLGLLVWAYRRRLTGSLASLERAVVRMGQGDREGEIEVETTDETRRLAKALDFARRRTLEHTDALIRARQTLGDELAQARARLRDPVADRRQERVVRLGLTAHVSMGRVSGRGQLWDLWLDHVVVLLDRSLGEQLVRGQPVQIAITTPEGAEISGEAIAASGRIQRPGAKWVWTLDWAEPASPADVLPELWAAINPRRALRVHPGEGDGLRGVLHVRSESYTVEVLDLSPGGAAILAAVALDKLGTLGGEEHAALTLELPGEHVVQIRIEVRSLECRATGTRLGIAFRDPRHESLQALLAYLQRLSDPSGNAENRLAEYRAKVSHFHGAATRRMATRRPASSLRRRRP